MVWMLNMTPEKYSQVRMRNGSSWLKSSAPAPSRARLRPMPTLNSAWNARAGMASSQYQVSGSPEASTITVSTSIDMPSCSSSISTYPMGRQARGNGRALISGRLSGMTRDVVMNARGEVEDEDPGDEEGQEVRHTAAGVQDDAEDQVVDGGVQQRGEHLPQLAQPGLGVHRDVARGGEAHDEVPPVPQLPGVD